MPAATIPANDPQRLTRLQALAILDTEAEPLFDALAQAAASVTGRPIALISLIDTDRQWFKANIGLTGVSETSRDSAFCAHTILGTELMEVPDAQCDVRFADNPLVTGAPEIRFYAGAPITLRDGLCMGSLCVIDRKPGALDAVQRATLIALAQAVAEALELRRYANDRRDRLELESDELRRQMELGQDLAARLQASEALLARTGELAEVGGWRLDLATMSLIWSDQTCRIHDLPAGYQPRLEEAILFYAPEARPLIQAAVEKAIATGVGWDLQLPLITASGHRKWVRAIGSAECDAAGKPQVLSGAFQDVTVRQRVIEALESSDRRFRKLFEYSLGLICTHDHEGVLLSINPAAANALGYSVGEMIGRPLTDFIRPARHAAFHDYLVRILLRDSDAGVIELVARDGSLRIWQYSNVLDQEGQELYVLGHAQDVTERQQHERKLLEWSIRDSLTGCYNRRYLAELVATSGPECWGSIVIDLDHFKQVNDSFGHQRGDEVLKAMAGFLGRHVRPEDAVFRLGGDEFLVLLRDADEALTDSVVQRIDADRAAAPIAFTMGAATIGEGTSLEAGLVAADRRLYQVRESRPRPAH